MYPKYNRIEVRVGVTTSGRYYRIEYLEISLVRRFEVQDSYPAMSSVEKMMKRFSRARC